MFILKIGVFFHRIIAAILQLPKRLKRIVVHFEKGIGFWKKGDANKSDGIAYAFLHWSIELAIYTLELFGLGEIYESVSDFVKYKTRPLSEKEISTAKEVFGNAINYERVRIDEGSYIGPKQKHFCYVSFYLINSWGPMQESTLIHELVHVWQYEKFGAVYMARALRAQRTPMGYNYGGLEALRKGNKLTAFNMEQQGDIIADYFRIKRGYKPRWGEGGQKDLAVYEKYVNQLNSVD